MILHRSFAVLPLQLGNASLAAVIAAVVSWAFKFGTLATASELAGLSTCQKV